MKTHLKLWVIAGVLMSGLAPVGYVGAGPGVANADAGDSDRLTGRVKYFNESPGYGYIIPDNKPAGSRNIRFYWRGITDHKALDAGDRVEFSVRQNARELEAVRISRVG